MTLLVSPLYIWISKGNNDDDDDHDHDHDDDHDDNIIEKPQVTVTMSCGIAE